MAESLQTALLLFVVGMITVFIILIGVIFMGKLIIRIVNYLHKEILISDSVIFQNKTFSKKKIAVITAVVDEMTAGRAVIEKIEKI